MRLIAPSVARSFQWGVILTITPQRSLTELQLAEGYSKLCALDPAVHPKFVPLAAVGHHEVRMVAPVGQLSHAMPMFWLELFDTCTEQTVDSYRCHAIKDANAVFEHFVAQAAQPDENP
jgi:hypothetical protein